MTETRVFEHRTLLRHPRRTVFDWLAAPGALQRMNPPFASELAAGPSDGLREGSQTRLRIGAPGSLGLFAGAVDGALRAALPAAVSRRIPAALSPRLPWRARHTAYEEGRMFRDEMASGPLSAWRHTHSVEDAAPGEADTAEGEPGAVVVDRVEYALPGVGTAGRLPVVGRPAADAAHRVFEAELRRQFEFRGRVMAEDLDFHAGHPGPLVGGPARTVLVTGAGGLVGTQLCALLTGGGHRVIRLVRSPAQAEAEDAALWDPAGGTVDTAALRAADVVVNLAGEPLAGRFTEKHRRAVHDSRVDGTRTLVDAIARLPEAERPTVLVNGSAVGWYGADAGAGPDGRGLTEDLPAGDDFLAGVVADWEAQARRAEELGLRVVRVRTGIVLSPTGGMLAQLLPLFLAGAGGPVATRGGRSHDGSPWISWIGVDDIAGVFAHAALAEGVVGAVNGTAPEPVTAKEFARVLGTVLHRPAAVPVPEFGPRLLLGEQGAAELVRADQKASAELVLDSGYAFRDAALEGALRRLLGR